MATPDKLFITGLAGSHTHRPVKTSHGRPNKLAPLRGVQSNSVQRTRETEEYFYERSKPHTYDLLVDL